MLRIMTSLQSRLRRDRMSTPVLDPPLRLAVTRNAACSDAALSQALRGLGCSVFTAHVKSSVQRSIMV